MSSTLRPGEPTLTTAAAASGGGASEVVEELTASDALVAETFSEYVGGWWKRVRAGQSGILPVLAGLVLLVIIFQVLNSNFLTAANLTNLMTQGAPYILLGMAEVFVLLLGEIDLSIGYVAGISATVTLELAAYPNPEPWWVAILAGLAAAAFLGLVQGTLITRLGLPSFVVTLGGLLGFEGLMLFLLENNSVASGGTVGITNNILTDIVNGNLDPTVGWITMIAVVAIAGLLFWRRDFLRRRAGLAAPPAVLTYLKIAAMAVAGVIVVWICNTNRGRISVLEGVPWVVPIALVILVGWSFLLGRTRYGRYIYAIGGNAEAARRAGISLGRIRTIAFILTSLTAGAAGIVYASQLGSISNGMDGGTLVLDAVAAAVIGGTSLFGGRGKMLHALVGGIIIAAIANGMGLLGLSAAAQYMITALVLVAAVTVDALSRKGATATR
ncbi:MAG: ABC transporter permease [Actinomycetota bacterium]|jgi:D-xylose transport system permease protein|nr:ABC transporter permease [Actinomycetota bacterium]